MKFARVQDGVVAEVFSPPEGVDIQDCFTAELVAQFKPCGADVMSGWVRKGKGFSAPAPILRNIEPEADAPSLADLKAELSALQAKVAEAMKAAS